MNTMLDLMKIVAISYSVLVLLLGLVIAALFLLGRKELVAKLFERTAPAVGVLFGTTVVATLILLAARAAFS